MTRLSHVQPASELRWQPGARQGLMICFVPFVITSVGLLLLGVCIPLSASHE